jgi:hypothetical protein
MPKLGKLGSFGRNLGPMVLFAALVAGCDGGGPSGPNGTGRLAVRMTDAPIDDVAQINVHITGLTVKRVDAPVERIANDVGTFDLLTLADTSVLLTSADVQAGDYEFIRVELSENGSSIVLEGSTEELPLSIASDEIKVQGGGFTVNDDGTTTVLLDFDAKASLVQQGNGQWLLTPVISLVNSP